MLEVLQTHGQLAAIQADSPEQSWRLLLADRVLGAGPITERPRRQQHIHQQQQAPVAGQQRQHAMSTGEQQRRHALSTGQQRQELPTGLQQQQQQQQRRRRLPPTGQQQQQGLQLPSTGEQQQQPTPMEAIATYVIEAWKLRSAALAGRGTNGGNPVV
jgi:hypothetical protein